MGVQFCLELRIIQEPVRRISTRRVEPAVRNPKVTNEKRIARASRYHKDLLNSRIFSSRSGLCQKQRSRNRK